MGFADDGGICHDAITINARANVQTTLQSIERPPGTAWFNARTMSGAG
jgi:hypothetical protein